MSLRVLDRAALPSVKEEQWQYTNLERALGEALLGAPPEAPHQVLIHKSSGELCEKAEDVVWIGEDKTHHQLRLKIVLEEGAQVTVIERHEGKGAYWKNMGTEIVLKANARLNHIRIQDDSSDAIQTNMVHVTMDKDSYMSCCSLNMGGKMVRHDVHVVMNGSGGECYVNGVNLLKGEQHGDTTVLMEHVAPHCMSNQFYRTILDNKAHGVFQGKVHVHKEAQKTDGYQLANTILLSRNARMNTKPELEIYADDVKCSHGTTTGQLDEEPLFYLRSRGLSDAEARMLLVQAFVDEAIDRINEESSRDEIKGMAARWLREQLNL